jgi:hypothetical protein
MGIAAGANAAAPFIAKGIGSLFGLNEASEEERRAERMRQDAINRLTAQAEGRTASAAQLAAQQATQRTQQALIGMAQKGSVQQRAGNVRAAMQAAPEVMTQNAAVAAQTRAQEMDRARMALADLQMQTANAQSTLGRQNREYMQRVVGAGIQGAAAASTLGIESPAPKTPGGGGGGEGGGGAGGAGGGAGGAGGGAGGGFNEVMAGNQTGAGGQQTEQLAMNEGQMFDPYAPLKPGQLQLGNAPGRVSQSLRIGA